MTNPMERLEKLRKEFAAKRREYLADLAERLVDGSDIEALEALGELYQCRHVAQQEKSAQDALLHGNGSAEQPLGVLYATTKAKRRAKR